MFGWLKKLWSRGQPDTVTFDEERILRTLPDGKEESVRWSELSEISIITTDGGPWAEDVFWLFLGPDSQQGCVVPGSWEGINRLLRRLQQLPGFDDQEVIRAMGSTSNNRFVVWRKV